MSIKVNYESTNDAIVARSWLASLPSLFSADFEVAVKYTPEEIELFKDELETTTNKLRRIELQGKIKATALGHPSHCVITHLSVAWSESDSYVFIIDNEDIAEEVLTFLITTDYTQIWHNAGYDFRILRYFTGASPKSYEDTQLRAKCLRNHVEVHKAQTGLKQLAGHVYGSWSIASEYFDVSQMYKDKVLLYAATDACATYWLHNSIESYLQQHPEEI